MPPEIALTWPDEIYAGEEVELEVGITVHGDTSIGGIVVSIECAEGWAITSGSNRGGPNSRREWPAPPLRIAEGGVLIRGTSIFPFRFTMPRDLPPTHQIDAAYSSVEVWVRVERPWWFDARERFAVPVRLPQRTVVVTPSPATAAGRSGSAADSPRIELAVASSRMLVGDTLVGSCAVFHVPDDRPREIEVSLAAAVPLYSEGKVLFNRSRTVRTMAVTVPAGSAGTAVPFELPIPRSLPPSFVSITHAVAWSVVAASEALFSHKMEAELALELFDDSATMAEAPT